jgi:hypothetical protein
MQEISWRRQTNKVLGHENKGVAGNLLRSLSSAESEEHKIKYNNGIDNSCG